jgi:thiamine biosynthesis protein ThiS
MQVTVNGERCTVAELLSEIGVAGRFAVEVSAEIVARSTFATRELSADDSVEIVKAIGGG